MVPVFIRSTGILINRTGLFRAVWLDWAQKRERSTHHAGANAGARVAFSEQAKSRACFPLKDTQSQSRSKRFATRVRNNLPALRIACSYFGFGCLLAESKKIVPGLKCYNISFANGSKGTKHQAPISIYEPNMTNFLLLNPDFFFNGNGPAQKAVLAPFWGVFSAPPPPPLPIFFLISGGFQW
jgi:hypothetical protein